MFWMNLKWCNLLQIKLALKGLEWDSDDVGTLRL